MGWCLAYCILICIAGCAPPLENQVKLATDLDKELAGPIVSAFYRAEQGSLQPEIRSVQPNQELDGDLTDDVLWTRDVLAMEELSQQGKLQPIRWSPDRLLSTQFASPIQTWQAFVASAMVIIVRKDIEAAAKQSIDSLDDLADGKWQGRCGIADPARSQATLLALAAMAKSTASVQPDAWLQQVAGNAAVLPGEIAVLTQVDRGELDWGVVSSDLAAERLDRTAQFEMIFPDQQSTQMGTVLIPHVVAVKATAPHPYAASRLANYLASPKTAERLAMGEQSLVPLSTLAEVRPRILEGRSIRWAQLDYKSLGAACDQVRAAFATVSNPPAAE